MTRIISGLVGGRRLATPAGVSTRPTSDRVREALFSRLEHQEVLQGARVLDLYAGSGALGLEALSRGAARATLIDSDKGAAKVARLNAQALGFGDVVTVRAEPVERALLTGPDLADGRADLAFLDPPYDLAEDRLGDVLALLVLHRWLAPDALVVVERSARSPQPRWPSGLSAAGERRYGETKVWFADASGPDELA
ncbi:MAG TPA: 16S rRNA (guanine(966)-N(2))-methyltransferase RsmD [Dermatophilaceae bacterium]|nr:16S rRNA (guanine(966)-N(2))-methyltransferase RsmD [Dermatophilaceae bacterium]